MIARLLDKVSRACRDAGLDVACVGQICGKRTLTIETHEGRRRVFVFRVREIRNAPQPRKFKVGDVVRPVSPEQVTEAEDGKPPPECGSP